MFIGLTGGIASGKNFVASLFERSGFPCLDADQVGRVVMEPGEAAYIEVVNTFGREILTGTSEINRGVLRQMVAEDPYKLKKLESILHPAIAAYSQRWYKNLKAADDQVIAVYHAPLLVEAGIERDFDYIVLVYACAETQKKRLMSRGYPPYEDGLKLMDAQLPYVKKLECADFVVDNDGGKQTAENDVLRIVRVLEMIKHTRRVNKRVLKKRSHASEYM